MKKLSKQASEALNLICDHGYEAFVVGGAVRDLLLNKEVLDYDITTNADPNAIKMIFSDYVKYDVGKKHGTVTILIDKEKIDITPYRKEDKYTDHRHPDLVSFSSDLKEDLSRRDFTINAMCIDKDNNVIDMFGGKDDLERKLIRCIGDPYKRFDEDGLRILRALRFKVRLGFAIEEKTAENIHLAKDFLYYISQERKKEELLKILSSKDAFKLINEYLDVFATFMPFEYVQRKINDFYDPFYALAFLLIDKDVDLKKLKYSNEESELINILIDASKIDLNDDYQFIECLSSKYRQDILTFLEEYHHKDLSLRYKKLRRYIVTRDELKLNGQKIAEYGYSGKAISKVKQKLLDQIHRKKLHNTAYALDKYLRENVGED